MIFDNLYTFYTGMSRDASKVLSKQKKRSSINNSNLLKIRDQSEELFDLIKSNKFSIKSFGDFLENGWELKKNLADQVSNKFIDDAYSTWEVRSAKGWHFDFSHLKKAYGIELSIDSVAPLS